MGNDRDCVFCKIISGEIPSPRSYEDENTIGIPDLHPQAKRHFLLIPKKHVVSLAELFADEPEGQRTVGRLFSAANALAKREGLLPGGYRSVINTGIDGGQSVFHLHLHLLGGEKLKERLV
jgi:histidine triad (HIT) family protein